MLALADMPAGLCGSAAHEAAPAGRPASLCDFCRRRRLCDSTCPQDCARLGWQAPVPKLLLMNCAPASACTA